MTAALPHVVWGTRWGEGFAPLHVGVNFRFEEALQNLGLHFWIREFQACCTCSMCYLTFLTVDHSATGRPVSPGMQKTGIVGYAHQRSEISPLLLSYW